jgi:protein gp37
MSIKSSIEWTDATWNPVRGCVKVSPGCKNCYAERFAERFRGVEAHPFEHGFDLRLVPEKLREPFRWSTPRMVFVNSMSDLFQDGVPTGYISAVGQVMKDANRHTYQVLTKRQARMKELISGPLAWMGELPNVWFGVSVEDRKYGLPRIEVLLETPVRVRFLSVEPLLEDLGTLDLRGIDWVIVGGESGPKARPMEERWVLSLLYQCRAVGVPFFFKQWGGVRKHETGRRLRGKTYGEFPSAYKANIRNQELRIT